MRNTNRWTRAVMAVACLLAGLTSGPAPALAEAPTPPVPDQQAPAGGGPSHLSPPGSCDYERQTWSTSPGVAIPDNNVITSTISFPAMGAFIWEVWVTTDLTHTNSSDLDIVLVSPAGTRVTLTTDNGSTYDNVFNGTLWADNAGRDDPPGPVTLATYADNVTELYLSPEEPLSAFLGETTAGNWHLEVRDDAGNASLGRLNNWDLQITALATTPTPLFQSIVTPVNQPVPDGGALLVPFEMPAPFFRYDTIELVTNLSHANVGDLEIHLLPAENGSTIVLDYHQGGNRPDVISGTHWLDAAGAINPPGAVTDNAFGTGVVESPLAPQEPLRGASGSDRDGPWTLVISDTVSNLTGTLYSLTANVTSYACGPSLRVEGDNPFFARLDAPIPLEVEVENSGLAVNAALYLTVTLPIGGSYVATNSPGWSCVNPAVGSFGGTVFCNRPNLASSTVSPVTVLLRPPSKPQAIGDWEASLTMQGDESVHTCECMFVYATAHSANNNAWDVYDNLLYPTEYRDDGGAVDDGGQDAFDAFGELRLAIFDTGGNLQLDTYTAPLIGFGLAYTPAHRWRTTTPIMAETIQMARSLFAPANANWLRYVDTFTNTGGAGRTVYVAWGGDLGSDSGTALEATSSGDLNFNAADTWGVTIEDGGGGLAADPPVAYVLRSASDTTYQGPFAYGYDPITTTWGITGDGSLAHVYRLELAPGASASLAYFLYRGLAEGFSGPEDCAFYGDCLPAPAAGSQQTLAVTEAMDLALHPAFCDLGVAELSKIVNWPGAVLQCRLYVPVTFR